MSDDLVKRLRSWVKDIHHEGSTSPWALDQDLKTSANRIEQLAATNEELEAKLSKSEALLAKAVEELEGVQEVPYSCVSHGILMTGINYALAELKGEK